MSVTGELINSEIVDGMQEFIWEIPAIREQAAKRKAKINSRVKGLEDITILNVENLGSGRVPGQNIFKVTVEAPR